MTTVKAKPSLRSLVSHRTFTVRFLLNGEVQVTPERVLREPIDHAVCSEIQSHLEDAIQGWYIGGYDFTKEHPEYELN